MHESMYQGYVPTCDDPLNDLGESCKLTKQEDGSTLMTYAVEGDNGLKSLVVERYVGDIRVTVEANNSAGPSRDQVDPTGSVPPVLTLEQPHLDRQPDLVVGGGAARRAVRGHPAVIRRDVPALIG